MSNAGSELVPYEAPRLGVVRPVADASEMLDAVKEYEALKRAIIQPSDVQMISNKQHIKKSGWLRIARAFGLTVEKVSEEYIQDETGYGYAIVMRAIAPNGASMQGDGMCWSTEKRGAMLTRHNVRAHAYTRATNRAISNLVGGGEVSAEEINDDEPQQRPQPARRRLNPIVARDYAEHPMPRIVEERRYPEYDDRAISDASRKAAEALGITGDDYAKAFAAQVNDGRPIDPAQITRKQREDWYAYLDKQLAATAYDEPEVATSFDDPDLLKGLDPHQMKVS